MNDAFASSHPTHPPVATLDPAADSLPDLLRIHPDGGPPVVLLVDAAERPEWAADVAIALATEWASGERRVVLADLHLEEPILHERVGTQNLDGVVDVLLYGASLARSAKPVPGRGFFLISAGTYAPDADAVLRHPRWPKLVKGFREADALLLLFVRGDGPDLASLAPWMREAFLLGDGGSVGEVPEGVTIRARVVPPAGEVAEEADVTLEGGMPPVDVPVMAAASALSAPGPEIHVERVEPDLPPPDASRRRSGSSGPSLLLWVLLAVVLLGGLAYAFLARRPELVDSLMGESEPLPTAWEARESSEEEEVPAGTVAGIVLPYSVQVKAFVSDEAARDQVEVERQRLPETLFYISPELIQGILYYRVLAGVSADTSEASRLRERLVEAGSLDQEDAQGSWSLRYTPYTFQFGEFPTAPEARVRADSLARSRVPAYLMPLPYSNGSERWRLYGGAFQDSAAAEGMRGLLRTAGVEAPLVERVGRGASIAP